MAASSASHAAGSSEDENAAARSSLRGNYAGPFYNEVHHSVRSETAYTGVKWAMRDLIELTDAGSLQYAGPIGHLHDLYIMIISIILL